MEPNLLQVDILGTSLHLRTDDDLDHLKQVIWLLKRKIQETRDRNAVSDPLKLSILTGIYLVDELMKKSQGDPSMVLDGFETPEAEEMERMARRMIRDIDSVLHEEET